MIFQKYRNFFLLSCTLLVAHNLHGQSIQRYTPGDPEEGIVYYLPKTQIYLTAYALKMSFTPGELYQYANRYMRIDDVRATPATSYVLQQIGVRIKGTPDPDKAFVIKVKDRTQMANVELTDDQILKAVNTSHPGSSEPQPERIAFAQPVNARRFMTEEMLNAGSTAKLAELVAHEIYNIRESRNNITRGQADNMPKDGLSMKLMLDNLNKQERALLSLFVGSTDTTLVQRSWRLDPMEVREGAVAFRFSALRGLLDADDLSGEPVRISIQPLATDDFTASDEKILRKPKGVIYNIPGKAIVTVTKADKTYAKEELPFAQLGHVEVLVGNLFNKKNNTRVVFNPDTGGVLKIDRDE